MACFTARSNDVSLSIVAFCGNQHVYTMSWPMLMCVFFTPFHGMPYRCQSFSPETFFCTVPPFMLSTRLSVQPKASCVRMQFISSN